MAGECAGKAEMREHETYETFCRWCLARFERETLADSLKATEEHEREKHAEKTTR